MKIPCPRCKGSGVAEVFDRVSYAKMVSQVDEVIEAREDVLKSIPRLLRPFFSVQTAPALSWYPPPELFIKRSACPLCNGEGIKEAGYAKKELEEQ